MLTTVGGWLDCYGADTRASFPVLKEAVAGNLLATSTARDAFRREGFLFVDGILSTIVSSRTLKDGSEIHRITTAGKTKPSYCIENVGTFAHGDTIREARESLLYKTGERDKTAYAGWTMDRKITKKEAIESYRVITGACEAGVKQFVQSHGKLRRKYTVREVIEITRGQFGNREYADFFGTAGENQEDAR